MPSVPAPVGVAKGQHLATPLATSQVHEHERAPQ